MSPTFDSGPSPLVSPTLAADALVAELRREGRTVYHMGFGQAPFPAPERMVQALRDHAHEASYLPVAGLPELRRVVAQHQGRHAAIDPAGIDVLIAPGSKLILYALQMAIQGDLLLPTPSWVSYRPQASMLGQKAIAVPTELSDHGYHIDADFLERTIVDARASGQHPTKLLLNYPNNPTGLTLLDIDMRAIADVCLRHDIVIIADEIYGRLSFDGHYRSIAAYAPDNTVVTTGLSKHLSLGGWRLGVGLVPKAVSGLFDALVAIASETWSCVAAPVQIASIEAYDGHADVEAFIEASTNIHANVTHYIADRFHRMGIPCPMPQGGFYAWPDFGTAGDIGPFGSFRSSPALANALIEIHGIVTLPGTAFGEAEERLNMRLSACDYDGAVALEHHRDQQDHQGSIAIETFAPRIAMAMNALEAISQR